MPTGQGSGPVPGFAEVVTDLQDEIAARDSADSTLQGDIVAEAAARAAADGNEEAARIANDGTLTDAIAAETVDRQAAVSAETEARVVADNTIKAASLITRNNETALFPQSQSYTHIAQLHDGYYNGEYSAVGPGVVGFYYIQDPLAPLELAATSALLLIPGITDAEFNIYHVQSGYYMLSTPIRVDGGDMESETSSVPCVIDTTKSFVKERDVLRVDTTLACLTASGLIITMEFEPV